MLMKKIYFQIVSNVLSTIHIHFLEEKLNYQHFQYLFHTFTLVPKHNILLEFGVGDGN